MTTEQNKKSAIVRRCDICGVINAIDLVWTEDHEREMQLVDHTISRVTEAEALELWKNAGKCNHKELIADLRAEIQKMKSEKR